MLSQAILLAVGVGLASGTPSRCVAASPDAAIAQSTISGVTVEALPIADRVVFCITAVNGVKVSGMYGVTFDTDAERRPQWSEKLPKTISSEDWEFALPLRIEIKVRATTAPRPLRVQLGACSDRCDILKFNLQIPALKPAASTATFCSR